MREAKKADNRIARRMLDSHLRKNTYKLYKRGDKVFVRVGKKCRVEDIAIFPRDGINSRKLKRNIKKLLIPLIRSHHTYQFKEYVVKYDPPGDGNCQFSAICFRLSQMEILRSAETLRSSVFNYFRDTEVMNGVSRELFKGVFIEQYFYEISLEGTYRDKITLANFFNVEVVAISTLGKPSATTQEDELC